MKIRELFNLFHFERKPKCRERRDPFQVRLRVEELEPRLAPAQNTFTGAVSPAWGLAANWSTLPGPDRIPGPGDILVFGNPGSTGSSTVDAVYSVDRINMNSSYMGPLFVGVGTSITTTNYIDQWGVLRVYPGALINTNGAYYVNSGATIVSAPGTLAINASGGFDHGGTIDVLGGSVLSITTSAFVGQPFSTIFVEPGGVLFIAASNQIDFNGDIVVGIGGALVVSAPVVTVNTVLVGRDPPATPIILPPPPTVTGAISAGTFINQHGIVTTGPAFTSADVTARINALPPSLVVGRVDIDGNVLRVRPGAVLGAGDESKINITGTMEVEGTANLWHATATVATLTLTGGTLLLGATSNGFTTMTVNTPLTIGSTSTVTAKDSLSTLNVPLGITNQGTMNVINGKISTTGLVVAASTGVLNMQGASVIQGTLDVQGTLNQNELAGGGAPRIEGNLTVSGTFRFNHAGDGVMIVTVTGNYTQTSTGSLWMRINGAQSGMTDQIVVSGSSSLGGNLNVSAYGTVALGNSWILIDGTTMGGAFASVSLPPPPPNTHWWYGVYSGDYKIMLMFGP